MKGTKANMYLILLAVLVTEGTPLDSSLNFSSKLIPLISSYKYKIDEPFQRVDISRNGPPSTSGYQYNLEPHLKATSPYLNAFTTAAALHQRYGASRVAVSVPKSGLTTSYEYKIEQPIQMYTHTFPAISPIPNLGLNLLSQKPLFTSHFIPLQLPTIPTVASSTIPHLPLPYQIQGAPKIISALTDRTGYEYTIIDSPIFHHTVRYVIPTAETATVQVPRYITEIPKLNISLPAQLPDTKVENSKPELTPSLEPAYGIPQITDFSKFNQNLTAPELAAPEQQLSKPYAVPDKLVPMQTTTSIVVESTPKLKIEIPKLDLPILPFPVYGLPNVELPASTPIPALLKSEQPTTFSTASETKTEMSSMTSAPATTEKK